MTLLEIESRYSYGSCVDAVREADRQIVNKSTMEEAANGAIIDFTKWGQFTESCFY